MIKTILCPIDVSEGNEDRNLLSVAWQLAELHGAKVEVMTVVPDFGMSVVGQFFEADHLDKAVKHAQDILHQIVTEALGKDVDNRVNHLVATGNAYEQILEVAEKVEADLIVIGAHKPDFKDYLLGPNAARVASHSKCSVYVVRS